jgi:hypothetical protein
VSIHPSRNSQLNALPPGLLARRAIIAEDLVHLFERLASRLGHEQNTAKKTYAPKPVFSTSGGVIRPMIKLKSQLQEVESL